MSLARPLGWPLSLPLSNALGDTPTPMLGGSRPSVSEDETFPAGRVGVAYDHSLAITGGTAPYVLTSSSGTPDGLTLSIDGSSLRLQGTPTVFDVYALLATITDDAGQGVNVEREVLIDRATFYAAGFQGDAEYARLDIAIGGVGCINFEIQALVYIEGAPTSEDRVFMVQFPASRQCGLFAANTAPHDLRTGDSQVGSIGGQMVAPEDGSAANPPAGVWCFLTFSCDGTTGTSGLMQASVESLDETTRTYAQGGRTKGVEDSLQGNRVDLNGGGRDFGWANGIRYAEVRAYNGQRSQVQRQADKFNTSDTTGALFWWRFSDAGDGSLSVGDLTGNDLIPTIVGGTLEAAPTI